MRSVTNGLAEGLSFNLPKSWARIPERTELCNEEDQAIAATLIARFQNPDSHRFVLERAYAHCRRPLGSRRDGRPKGRVVGYT